MPHLCTGPNRHCPKQDRGNCVRADSGRSCTTHQYECKEHNWVWMPEVDEGCYYCNTGTEPGQNQNKSPAPSRRSVRREKFEKKQAKMNNH